MVSSQQSAGPDTGPRVQVISRVGQILRALAEDPRGLPLAQVVVRTGLPKSTAYRLLIALQEESLVESHEGRFRVGRALAGARGSRDAELSRRLRPLMERLSLRVQETVDLGVLVGDQILFVEQVRWHRELSVGAVVGELYPAWAPACGKALLAASADHLALPLATTSESSSIAAPDPAGLGRELARAASEKLAYDREGFHPGVCGLATFAHMANGVPVALGIVVPSDRFEQRLEPLREELLAVHPILAQITATV